MKTKAKKMKLTISKVLTAELQKRAKLDKRTKDYEITFRKMNFLEYSTEVDYRVRGHWTDEEYATYNYLKEEYYAIRIRYPYDYYACDRYLGKRDLEYVYNHSDGTADDFFNKLLDEIEV